MTIPNRPAAAGGGVAASAIDWEQVATTTRWGSHVASVERRSILAAELLARPASEALDIGCDKGRWARMLADLGWRMTCVDVNSKALAACQIRIPAARCILADPLDRTLPLQSGSVGLILCVEVAQVIQSDWFIPEACRVLKSRGILVGVAWNRLSWRGLYTRLRSRGGWGGNPTFYTRSYGAFRSELLRSGFVVVQEEGFCWEPFPRRSDSPLVPLFASFGSMLRLNRLASLSPWVAFVARKAEG